jgi:hypothetical protein
MLAAFARGEPGPLAPAESFWHRWRLQWLAPAAAMATALAVWVAVPRDRPTPAAQARIDVEERTTIGAARPGAGAAGEIDRPPAAEAPVVPSTAASQDARELAQLRQGSQQGSVAAGRGRDLSRNAAGSPDADGTLDSAAATLQKDARDGARNMAGARPPSEPPRENGPATAAKSSAPRETGEPSIGAAATADTLRQLSAALPSTAVPPPPPAPATSPPAAASPFPAPVGQAAQRLDRREADSARVAFNIISPDAVHRWRIDSAGQLQHSSSGGATWQSIALATPDVLTAGASPEGSVCWLVGRNGAVWLTTDGLRFDRRAVPAPVDLMSVRSTDARRATVVASDGRRFVSADGGVTWAPAAP